MLENGQKNLNSLLMKISSNKRLLHNEFRNSPCRVNPFASLDTNFWMNYTLLYIISALIIIFIHRNISGGISPKNFIIAIISPFHLLTSQIVKSLILFQCLISFGFWTFNILFGVDLWSSLVKQTFESEVNSWDDISWFETQFVITPFSSFFRILSYSKDLLNYDYLYLRLVQTDNTLTKVNAPSLSLPSFHYQNESNMANLQNAQLTNNPSDITFIMSKNSYINLGKYVIGAGMEYKMRLSKRPVYSYTFDNEESVFWSVLSTESLLTEPLSLGLQTLKVN